MNKTITTIFALLLSAAMPAQASVISDFDDATVQGWSVNTSGFNLFNPGSGGLGGGYLRLDDTQFGGSGGLAVAPINYMGDLSGYGSVSWDSILPSGAFEPVRLIIASNTTEYVFTPPSIGAAETWESWVATLDGGAGWTKTLGSESFAQVLANVSSFAFDLEVSSGTSLEAGIDNVTLNPIPVPAAAWLFLSGLFAVVGIGRRRAG